MQRTALDRVERLKKSAQTSYSARIVTTASELRRSEKAPGRCVLIARYKVSANAAELGFVALLKPDNRAGQGFVVKPLYVKVADAAAVASSKLPKFPSPSELPSRA